MPEEQPVSAPPTAGTESADAAPVTTDIASAIEQARLAYAASKTAVAEPQEPTDSTQVETQEAAEPTNQADQAASEEPDSLTPDESQDQEPEGEQPRLSRRARADQANAEAIKAAIAQYETERVAREAAEAQLRERQSSDQERIARVQARLGTKKLEDELIVKVAEGDYDAAAELKQLRASTEDMAQFWEDAQQVAKLQVFGMQANDYEQAKTLPGVDKSVMDTVPSLFEAFKHVQEATAKEITAQWKADVAKRDAEWEAKLQKAAGTSLPRAENGGRATGGAGVGITLYGPDGLPTAEALEAVRRGTLRPSQLGSR